jgi:hypothetical protein
MPATGHEPEPAASISKLVWSTTCTRRIHFTFSRYISLRHIFSIGLFFNRQADVQIVFSPSDLRLCISHRPDTCYLSNSCSRPWFDHHDNIRQIMMLLTIHSSLTSCYFFCHWAKYSPQRPFSFKAIAQTVSRRLPTAVALLPAQLGHVGFVAVRVTLEQVFFKYFGSPCQSSFPQILHPYNHPG